MLSVTALSGRAEGRKREAHLTELVARANYLMGESFYESFKSHGLSAAEWRVLGALSECNGLKMTELAALVLFKQPTLTKVIDRMERAQLVQRRPSALDRRCMIVRLTERGRRLAGPVQSRLREHEAALDRTLGKAASREIKAALAALVDRLAPSSRSLRLPTDNGSAAL